MIAENEIKDKLIAYIAGENIDAFFGTLKDKESDVTDLFGLCAHYWNAIECDPEGPTPEQDNELNAVLDEYSEKILEVIN